MKIFPLLEKNIKAVLERMAKYKMTELSEHKYPEVRTEARQTLIEVGKTQALPKDVVDKL